MQHTAFHGHHIEAAGGRAGPTQQVVPRRPHQAALLECRHTGPRAPVATYRGRSAKELGMALTEGDGPFPLSRLDHALYLGRELQKAERCLEDGSDYIQD